MKTLIQLIIFMLLLGFVKSVWSQDTLAWQGFEGTDAHNWGISSGANSSSDVGSGDSPASQRIKSGSSSHLTSNATNTLTLNGFSNSDHTSRYVEIWTSSTSATSGNGADGSDFIKVYVSNSNTFSSTADIEINGNSNVRYGMDGTGVMEITAGADSVYAYPSGGTKSGSDALSKIKINLSDAWTEIHVKIETSNNSTSEFWNIDDIRLIGTNSCSAPSSQPSGYSTSSISSTGMTVNWTRGSGDSVIVLARASNEIEIDPVKGTVYTADSDFSGSGSSIGGAKVVYKGQDTSVAITGLTAGTTYYFGLYEFNGTGTCYFSTQLTGSEATTCSTPDHVSGLAAAKKYKEMDLSWTLGTCYDTVVIVAKSASSISGTPTGDGSAYSADASFTGSGTAFDGGKVIYEGSGTSVTVTDLTEEDTYYFKAYTRKGSTWSSGVEVNETMDRVPKLIISEVIDPSDLTTARYGELFNADSFAINFSTYTFYFCRQTNGGTYTCKQLSGTLNPGDLYTIANNSADYTSSYSENEDDTWGNTGGNGDDGYFLYYQGDNSSGILVDAYGVPDVDGSGQAWEYTDSKAVRDSTHKDPEPTWSAGTWTITSSTFSGATAAYHASSHPQLTIATSQSLVEGKYRTLNINGTGQTVTALGDVTVFNALKLKNGLLNMNGNRLNLGSVLYDAEVTDASSSSYIYGGEVRYWVNNPAGTYKFEVGTNGTEYSRAEVSFSSATLGILSYLTCIVGDTAHPNLPSHVVNYIDRNWTISSNAITSPTYDVSLTYTDADINGSESSFLPVKYNSGWTAPGTVGNGNVDTMGVGSVNTSTNVLSWTGVTSFSIFTGVGDGSPLPVDLLYFKGQSIPEGNLLHWATSSEINASHFELEKLGTYGFESVIWLPAAGNSNKLQNYSWVDKTPNDGSNFYRLTQVDFDGRKTVYNIVEIDGKQNTSDLLVWSFEGEVKIETHEELNLNYSVLNTNGSILKRGQVESNFIDLSRLPHGVYILEIVDNSHQILLRKKLFR